jgi:type IV pilus assembly protein PilQ
VNVGDSAATTYPQPVVDTRKADTTLLIKNGMTVVLGGMRKKNVTKQINKIPVLGDIPVAGNLFKFKSEETVLSEIVVFITPWIIEEPIMTSDEQKAYESTEFPGPRPVMTKAEKEAEK